MGRDNRFGWTSAFREYGLVSLLKDSLYPYILSVLTLMLCIFSNNSYHITLNTIIDLSLTIMPTTTSIALACYVILLTLYCTKSVEEIRKKEGGSELLYGLNASFAVCMIVMFTGIFSAIIFRFIYDLHISSEYAEYINFMSSNLVLFLLYFTIWIMKDIVINLYNMGKASLLV